MMHEIYPSYYAHETIAIEIYKDTIMTLIQVIFKRKFL